MVENKIYSAIIGELELRESEGTLRCNGHHLAQKLTKLVSVSLLPSQQLLIYNALSHTYQTAKEISTKTGLPTKIISSQIKLIQKKSLLVSTKKINKNNSYAKKH